LLEMNLANRGEYEVIERGGDIKSLKGTTIMT